MDVTATLDLDHKVRVTMAWLAQTLNGMVENTCSTQVDAILTDKGANLTAWVEPTEIGKIIGKQGRNVRALRQMLLARGGKDRCVYTLNLMEADKREPLVPGVAGEEIYG